MIGISKLYCGTVEPSDALALRTRLRPTPVPPAAVRQGQEARCGLEHDPALQPEMRALLRPRRGTEQITRIPSPRNRPRAMIDDLAQFGAPVMLFSGGEPLVREDLVDLAKYATSTGMRAVISTNGTLITKAKAKELKEVGPFLRGHFPGRRRGRARQVPGRDRVPTSWRCKGVENCQAEGPQGGPALHHQQAQRRRDPAPLRPGRTWKCRASVSTTWSIPVAARN
jgi:hypothetical protein